VGKEALLVLLEVSPVLVLAHTRQQVPARLVEQEIQQLPERVELVETVGDL
jgi:hypothetical protein